MKALFRVPVLQSLLRRSRQRFRRCASSLRQQFENDGFCVIRGAFDESLARNMNRIACSLADQQAAESAERQQYTGSLIALTADSVFVELLTATPGVLAPLGSPYSGSRFMNGYVISKPGGGKRLYWHQDWWGWDKKASYEKTTPVFALMTYLTETIARSRDHPGNGCLRVIPGTHRRRHHFHNRVPDAHGDEISFGDMRGPAFEEDVESAVDVPLRPGDVVLVDVRLLHATRDNDTDERRSMITCWWVPTADNHPTPEAWRAEFAAQTTENPHDTSEPRWSSQEIEAVSRLYCQYDGQLGRYHGGPAGWCSQPGAGPGFEVSADDLIDPDFRFFGSGRPQMVAIDD